MIETTILDLFQLNEAKKIAYQSLTHEKFRCCLEGKDPYQISHSELLAIGAETLGKPIGLALGATRTALLPAELYSLLLDKAYHNKNIEALLLQNFEKEALEKGSQYVYTTFEADELEGQELEKLLLSHGWGEKVLLSLKCYFDTAAFHPLWFQKKAPLPHGCKQFPWKKLTADEKKHLLNCIEQGAIPSELSPFKDEEHIDWNSSLGLRNAKEVIGWMVNIKKDSDLLEFRSFFVFPEYQLQGHAVRLLTESIRRAQKGTPRRSVMEIYFNFIDFGWLQFIKKRLLPYAEKTKRSYQSWKKLS